MPRSTMPVMDWNYQELDSKSAFVELEQRSDDDALLKVARPFGFFYSKMSAVFRPRA